MSSSRLPVNGLQRRTFLRGAGLGALGLSLGGALTACGGSGSTESGSSGGKIGAAWFGGDDRHKRSVDAFKIIQKKVKGLKVDTSYGGYEAYFDKLTTQISSGTAPELAQMNGGAILADFAGRNALMDLSQYVGKGMDLSGVPKDEIDLATFDGKLYGVSLGTLTPACMVDTTALDKLGLKAPETWTWDQYAEFALEIHETSDKKIAGTEDASTYDNQLLTWLLTRDLPGLFTAEGKVAPTEDDLVEWFEYWKGMRASGACVPIKDQAVHTNGDHASNPVVTGKAALALQGSTTQEVWSTLTKNTLAFQAMPTGDTPGNWVRPGSLWSVPRGTEDIETTVKVIDLWMNDEDVAEALLTCRSVPNENALKTIEGKLTPAGEELVAYTEKIKKGPLAKPSQDPVGASEANPILKRVAEEVAFGKKSSQEAAKTFIEELSAAVSA